MNEIDLAICASGELYGGVEQFIYTFAQYLKDKREVNFIIILFSEGILHEKIKELNAPVEVIKPEFKYDLKSILRVRKLLKENNINILHVHGYKAAILGGIAAKLLGIKVIKTEHGRMEPSKGLGYLKMSLNLCLDKFFSKYFLDTIVFVSKDIQNYFNNTYSKIKKYLIYNGIKPIEIMDNEDVEIDRKYFNIGIVGRISEVKGHIYLLQAIRRLQHLDKIRLYIFGEGPLEKTYKNYCDNFGLSRNIFFMGFKSNIYDYQSKLDLLVMPSLHEGLPYTILEAMYMRVPIIASEVGGLKEVINANTDGILVPPKDVVGLSNAIETVYRSKHKRDFFTQNAYKKVCSKFLVSGMIKRYLDLYSDILRYELKI